MECVNANCQKRERLKQLFTYEERASGYFEFCPFCSSRLVSEASNDGKRDLQESQVPHEATNITKEEGAVLQSEEHQKDVLNVKETKKGEINISAEFKNESSSDPNSSSATPLSVENTNNPTISREPAKTSLSDENQTSPDTHNDSDNFERDNDIPHVSTETDVGNSPIAKDTSQHPASVQHKDDSQCQVPTQSALNNVSENAGPEKQTVHSRGNDDSQIRTLDGESSAGQTLASHLNEGHISSAPNDEHINLPANDTSNNISGEKMSLQEEAIGMEKLPLHSTAVDQDASHHMDQNTSIPSSGQQDSAGKEVNEEATTALDSKPVAVDQNSSASNHSSVTQIVDNHSVTMTTSPPSAEKQQTLQAVTTHSKSQRDVRYPPGHDNSSASSGSSILGNNCVFGPDSQTFSQLDNGQRSTEHPETSNSGTRPVQETEITVEAHVECEKLPAAQAISDKSDTSSSDEEEVDEFQKTSGPQRYDKEVIKQKRKEREMKRKRSAKTANVKKCKEKDTIEDMDVNELEASSDAQKPKKSKSNGNPNSSIQEPAVNPPKASSDPSDPSSVPKAFVHEVVDLTRKPGSGSGPDDNTSTLEQTTSHDSDVTSAERNVSSTTPSSAGASNNSTSQTSDSYNQPTIIKGIVSPTKNNVMGDEDCATIVFHALLSPDFPFNPTKEIVTVLLGHEELGKWKSIYTIFDVEKLESKYVLVTGELQLPIRLLTRPIPYKYVVINTNNDTVNWEYSEFSDNYPGQIVNRSLHLMEGWKQKNAMWHQYDGVVYPEPPKESKLKFWRRGKYVQFDYGQLVKNRQGATNFFLPKWHGFVQGGTDQMTALEAIARIKHLGECMKYPHVFAGHVYYKMTIGFQDLDIEKIIVDFLKPKLSHNARLKEEDLKDPKVRINRLVSSLAIAYLTWYFKLDLLYVDLIGIINCLTLGSTSPNRCDFDDIHMIFPENTWSEFSEAIVHLLKCANQKTLSGRYCPDNILAVPILHFFCGERPFEEPDHGDEISVEKWCHLNQFPNYRSNERMVTQYLPKSLQMFSMDPYFRRFFLCRVQFEDFAKVVSNDVFPFHELFKVLGFKVRASQLSTYGKAKVIEECLSKMTVRIKENIERHQVNAEEWLHLSQSAQFLIQELYKRDKGDKASDDVSLCIIKLISLILWGIDQQSKSNQSQMYKEKSESIFNSLLSEVEKAMDKELAFQMPSYLTGQKEELKVWSKLLESRFLVDEHNTKWNNELLLNFERRLKKLKPTVSIDLFCEMEKTDGINACLVEVITNHAFVEVEKIVENETSERSITILRDNLRHGTISSRAGELLSRIVVSARSKALSRFKGNPQNELLFILKWKPLPGFINSFGSFDNQKMLSTDAAELVQNVMTYIHLMQQAIRDRSIDVQTSILLRQHQDSFQNLCIALTKIKDFEQSTTFLKAEIVMKELQKRIEELERFQEIRDHIHNFLNICQSSKEAIFNTQELQERSDASISEMRLVDICQRDPEEEGGQISVTFFDLPEDLCVILPQLSSVQKSIGFQKFWKKNSRVAYKEKSNDELEGEGLTLVEIHKKVLEPSLVSWQQLSIKLFDGSLSLREIDKHFVKIPTKEEMEKELKIMFGPFKIAEHEVRKKMESRLKQIEEYKKLQEYIEAAETIWNFKEALSLKGDFKIIMQLRNQTSQEFKDKTLESIDHKFVEAAQFLNTISIEKSRCLQAVIDCEPLVKWLRETIKDTSALSTLVDLAMISAGENDMEVDRISNFHTSCLNFAPLVFDIDENIGFDDLMKVCQPVWHAVDDDKHLPEKLSETNRHLEWLKAVQSSHGSVEMSSLMQTKRINTYGVYSIGKISTSSDGKIGLESVLRLNVPMDERVQGPDRIDDQYLECEDKEESKTYSLNDLKTLQSKLMLIAGKTVKLRQKDSMESTEEINRFVEILEGAMRLGQVYIDLREAGDVKYLDWQEEVNCGEDAKLISTHRHVSKKLNATCLEMEERLKLWRQYVHDRRQRFQELNHFTTQQILVLRRELGALRDAGASLDQLPLHIYALLESVLSGTTSHHLLKVLNTVPGFSLDAASTESDGQTSPDQMDLGSRDTDTSYDSFFTNLEKMEFGEDVGIAALKAMNVLQGQEFNETDLLDWCMENGENSEEIDALVEQAREDPNYIDFFPELKEEPIEADEQENDSEMLTGTEEHHTEDFPDLDVPHKSYLTLDQLGDVLSQLHTMGTRPKERNFPDYLKRDQPNLVLVQSGDILTTVLTLYKKYGEETMPTSNEVILCTSETTAEEVELFWWRAFQDVHKQIFCLVNPDVLDYSVSQRSVYMFNVLQKQFGASQERRIVVICSTENEDRSHIIAAFDEYRVHATPSCATNDVLRSYLADQLTCSSARNGYYKDQEIDWHPASYLDTDKRSVRVISSERAGVGKTLVVSRLCERLMRLPNNVQMSKLKRPKVQLSVVVPLHGTTADTQQILDALWQHPVESNLPVSRIIHIDVSPSINEGLETVLFNLVVLGVLQDKTGCLWRRRSSDLYVIEMTNNLSKASSESKKTSFASLFPTIDCITPVQTLHQLKSKETKSSPSPLFDHQEFGSVPVQRAFQYLLQCDRGQSLDRYQYDPRKQMGTPFECLALIIKHCGISDPSWCELKHFIDFLNSQLQDCEESYYTNAANVDDQWMQGTMRGFKSFVVRFMVTMSRDFATPSLDDSPSIVCSAGLSGNDVDEDIRPLQLRRRWESSPHPYIFFNQDRITMTFLGFHVNSAGDLIDPDTNIVIDRGLMTKQLQQGLALQKVDFNTNYNNWTKSQRIEKLCMVMGLKFKKDFDPDPSYELTIDNMKKILAIHMRFRCGIPVVIMGETGCGKTQLIRYMCALQAGSAGQRNMLLMKVHGGTSYHDIRRKVEQAEEMAATNEKQGIDTVLFFDEANTTDALGMIKEVMVDRRINGRPIGVGLRRLHFIAACNPYRRHTDKMIEKLESAGLGYSVKANETKDKLGKIPLRHLVYRVHALPASMRPLVWDFGQLKPEIETLYISQIVSRYVIVNRVIPGNDGLVKAIAQVLAAAQKYMRQQQDECSFVSLRDVERAMTVMTWFYQHRDHLRPEIPQSDDSDEEDQAEQVQRMDVITWSLLLSLGVCYHAKLQDRKPFRERIITSCRTPIKPTGGQEEMLNEINRCQKVLIDELNLGPNIARNTALSENVFMMVVCIELRIPLFVIGKPGSSKSLAKTVVADNMQGDASKSPLFKKFKRAHMVSYQCSPLSNPEGIVATFRQCRRLQDNNSVDRYASVVVLDEVGLAEDSPLLPLKTLHPLLEDGVTSSDDVIETDEKPTRVAFIGISNWALDPAKMNRGLMLMRGEPDKKELADSAWGICSEREDIRNILSTLLKKLAAGYAALYKKQKDFQSLSSSKRDEFFGLRDFYSLVKMVYSIAADKDDMLSWQELDHAIRRNFGGLDEVDAVKIIAKHVKSLFHHGETQDGMPVKTLDLLRASLDHENAIGESRYLLVITENYSALPIVEQELIKNKDDYVVIFGSSFPKDQEYTQVCRNINQIKVCMETGRTVVLLNLESLYESLYDALNQYYVYCAGQKYVDLGLGSHRVKCRVDDTFRLIVIAEKDVVYKKFPIPLINRLEKHYLVTAKSLGPAELDLVKDLEKWAQEFATVRSYRHERHQAFHIGDAIIGYQSDTVPSMVLQICGRDNNTQDTPDTWTEQVKNECQSLLIQCATPDGIVRLPKTTLRDKAEEIQNLYFVEQEHSSLSAYLRSLFTSLNDEEEQGVLVQVSTHSRLLSENDLNDVYDATNLRRGDIKLLHLQQFQTEQQFLKQIREFFIELANNEGMLVVQCDSGDENFNLIACTRHLLIDQCVKRQELLMEKLQLQADSIRALHVVIVVQLPRLKGGCTNFVGFQGGRWKSVHIDDLRPQLLPIESSIDRPISDLLRPSWITDTAELSMEEIDVEMTDETGEEEIDTDNDQLLETGNATMERFDAIVLLRRSIQAAAGRLEDDKVLTKRTIDRIDLVLNLLPENSSKMPDGPSFARSLHQKIYELLKERNEKVSGDLASQWVLKEAMSGIRMHERGTFRKALQYKVLSEIEPLLAKILAFADRDCNLNLLVNQSQWLTRMWIRIFENKHMNEKYFDVSDTNMIRERVNMSGRGRHVFQCRFPFSWLVKDMVDGLARGAADVSSRSSGHETEVERIRNILRNSDLSDIFDCVSEEGQEEEAAQRYLHDFVHMVYYPTRQSQEQEIQIVSQYIMMTAESENELDGFIFDIATIHVTYSNLQTRINSFNQLIQAQPDITRLMLSQRRQMTRSIDVAALIVFLETLEPNMSELSRAEARNIWCGKVLSVRSSIEEMTSQSVFSSAYEDDEKELMLKCWNMWQRLSVVRLFITHVLNASLQEKDTLKYLEMIAKVFGQDTNFLTERSVVALERFLLECSQDFKKRNQLCDTTCSICKEESKSSTLSPCGHCFCMDCITRWVKDNNSCPECRQQLDGFKPTESQEIKNSCDQINKFRDHCNSFFMEVVSLFCFGYSPCGILQENTFQRLMSYVTGKEGTQTKPFSPFSDSMDVTPVVRSFLFQQLLRSSDRKVKEYMEQFIMRAQDVAEFGIGAAEVYAMSIQCMEDAYNSNVVKRTSELSLDKKLKLIETKYCKKAEATTRIPIPDAVDVEWLEGIAIIRFSLTFVAELMYKVAQDDKDVLQDNVKPILHSIFDGIERICRRPTLDKPVLFLLKQLSRRYGFDSIYHVAKTFNWILPEELTDSFEVSQDQFLVYGQQYQQLRETVARSIVDGDLDAISNSLQNMTWGVNLKNIVVVLALFHEITLNPNVQIADVVMENLHNFIQQSSDITPWCKQLSEELISDDEHYPRTITRICGLAEDDAWHANMVKIIIHLAVVLQIRRNNGPVGPLAALAFQPDSCINSFLPTMPDDTRQEIRQATGGVIHECPNGHPYVITECGRPMERSRCKAPGCGAEIGGDNHRLVANNIASSTEDQTRKGHCLGSPANRERTAVPERGLTPLATCLIRLLVHGSMLIGSCFHLQTVSQLISPNVQPNDVHRFLWDHLMRDMTLLSNVSGRSVDEISVIVHLLLENISIFNSMNMPTGLTVLRNKNQRGQWETFFANTIIGQVMNNLGIRMQETMRLITNDERFGSNPLLRQLYELEAGVEDPGTAITPNCSTLWRYRTPITLDHVTRKFNESSDSQSKDCVILGEFLKQERELRAVKLLPDVVKLQRLLMDRYHRSLDRTQTDKLQLKDFYKQIPKGSVNEYKALVKSFRDAWNIMVASIREKGTEGPLKKLSENEVKDTTPISMLIPTVSGLGACSLELTRFLVATHNDFFEVYKRYSHVRDLPTISVTEVTRSQLLSYDPDQDLLPLVHAHCHYSLEIGQGTSVEYDWPAVQRHLIDRLIRGRSLIDFKADEYTRTAVINAESVITSLKVKIPQVELSLAIQHQIVQQYRSLQDVCDALSSLNIAITFLSSGGGRPTMLLTHYLHNVLKLPEDAALRNHKAKEVCQLQHAVSLWRLLSIERARRLTRDAKDPFEHLSDEFKKPVVETLQMTASQSLRELNEVDLDSMVALLIEIITLKLNEEFDIDKQYSLKDYIEYNPLYHDQDISSYVEHIPDDVQLQHVFGFWQLVINQRDKSHERRIQATG